MSFGPLDRTIARALILALGIGVLVAVFPFAAGLIGAAVLYVVLRPLHLKIAARIGVRGSAAVLVTIAALLLALPAVWLVDVVVDEGPRALRALGESRLLQRLTAAEIAGVRIGVHAEEIVTSFVGWMSTRVFVLVGSGLKGMLDIVIALFGLYYLLIDGPRAWPRAVRYLPFSPANAALLRERFVVITDATLLGTALTALLQGLIVGMGFAATGLPNPPFWGTVTAVVSVLPVLGSALVWVPGSIALFAEGELGRAILLVVLGAVVASNVDNVARLVVNRRVARLHPMATLVGAFAGVPVFGIAGVLLGPLAISFFFELLKIYEQEYGPAKAVVVPPSLAAPPDSPRTAGPRPMETVP